MIQDTRTGTEHYDTVVVGGGQTGLTVGYELAQKGRDFLILDAADRVGDVWRNRWDSLRLFTPARYSGLPGSPVPANGHHFVTKDEVAAYLEAYAAEMELPIRTGTRVDRLSHDGRSYLVEAGGTQITADNVVVAMADFQVPKVPEFAPDLDPNIVQFHSQAYRNPTQLQEGPVLIVGLGNSGADIGFEVAQTHQTYISGEPSMVIPFRIEGRFARYVGIRLVKFFALNVLNYGTPMGRKALPNMEGQAAPLVRVKPKDLVEAGAERVGRVAGVSEGMPRLQDGHVLDVTNVIWCTGYRTGFSWIDLPVSDDEGRPRHERGVVADQPGLYFCGLNFLHALWSDTLPGMPRDARYVVDHLVSRDRARAEALT
ncbi:MAG: flavin-containing monooxygenase [Acidimicrobiia bacterium]